MNVINIPRRPTDPIVTILGKPKDPVNPILNQTMSSLWYPSARTVTL